MPRSEVSGRLRSHGPEMRRAIVCIAVVLVIPWARPAHAQGDTTASVHCYDPDREIVQLVKPGECDARVVSAEAAKRLKQELLRDRARKFRSLRPREDPERSDRRTGSGFYVSPNGDVATAKHVIEGCRAVTVQRSDGRTFPARVIARHGSRDLALLQTDAGGTWINTRPDGVAPDANPRLSVIGYPMQQMATIRPQTTQGELLRTGTAADPAALVLRAAVHPGNSGGPILSETGQFLGIVVAKLDTAKYFQRTGDMLRHIAVGISRPTLHAFLVEHGVRTGPPDDSTVRGLTPAVVRIACQNR